MEDKSANFLSLFASSSTLICCALPSLFVVIGAGASFANLLTVFPFLIVLSQYKIYITMFALVMIIFAGYENFVSKIHVAEESEDRPTWMGTVDFSELKLKLVASIVTISGINLLAAFMDLSQISDREIFWMVVVHLIFILSGVLLALMDFVTSKSKSI